MANKILTALLDENIDRFKTGFLKSSRELFFDENSGVLRHPGEFGHYREQICRDFLKFLIPGNFEIGRGFVINSNEKVSGETDLVVYDSNSTPLLRTDEMQRFFPIETVVAVGEVKSKLSKADFVKALKNLRKIKEMREDIKEAHFIKRDKTAASISGFDPRRLPHDQVFTFLICEEFDFASGQEEVQVEKINTAMDEAYADETDRSHRHNLILSIKDGLILYKGPGQPGDYIYPTNYEQRAFPYALRRTTDAIDHLKRFASYVYLGVAGGSIIFPDLSSYMNKYG